MSIDNVTFPVDLILRRKRKDTKGFNFYVEQPYRIYYEIDGEGFLRSYMVPKGYGTDLASVPAIFRSFISRSDAIEASVIHDHIYEFKTLPRIFADELFLAILEASGKGWFKRNIMWFGVRVGGWVVYNRVHNMNTPTVDEEWDDS